MNVRKLLGAVCFAIALAVSAPASAQEFRISVASPAFPCDPNGQNLAPNNPCQALRTRDDAAPMRQLSEAAKQSATDSAIIPVLIPSANRATSKGIANEGPASKGAPAMRFTPVI